MRFDRVIQEYGATGAEVEELGSVCNLLLTLRPAFSTVATMPEDSVSMEFIKCRLLDEQVK